LILSDHQILIAVEATTVFQEQAATVLSTIVVLFMLILFIVLGLKLMLNDDDIDYTILLRGVYNDR